MQVLKSYKTLTETLAIEHNDKLTQDFMTSLIEAAKTFATGRCTTVLVDSATPHGTKRRKITEALQVLEKVGLTEDDLFPCLAQQIKKAKTH